MRPGKVSTWADLGRYQVVLPQPHSLGSWNKKPLLTPVPGSSTVVCGPRRAERRPWKSRVISGSGGSSCWS